MIFYILDRLKIKIFILTTFSLFLLLLLAEAKSPSVDILIFSPHPDDAILCCAGTILKAIKDNKQIKLIFLTNADSTLAPTSFRQKAGLETNYQDYIALGEKNQQLALQAVERLGLEAEDVIFLSYPDKGLDSLWRQRNKKNYCSEATKKDRSIYKNTYRRAKKGYTKENLLLDITDILRDYRPKRIYAPYPAGSHPDHDAVTDFLHLALKGLRYKDRDNWIAQVEIFYYPEFNSLDSFVGSYVYSQEENYKEDITDFKKQKEGALKVFSPQEEARGEFNQNPPLVIQSEELFWTNAVSKPSEYLKQIEQEWTSISRIMKKQGYNINFAPVIDVAEDIEDTSIPLVRKKRIYSQYPNIVADLASAIIKGMDMGGITPVVKHFPGLGCCRWDTHTWLPQIEVTKKDILGRDFLPFQELINQGLHFWIMIDHAIYPYLSKEPASLSYEIQTKFLREELGFQGIIIVDELLCMQAMKEYAFQQKIKEPFIGEIVARVFQAGADIALFYSASPSQAKEVLFNIIEAVKKAQAEGRIKEEELDASVKRILAEKERIFGMPLIGLLKEMSLEEKITQKLITDIYCRTDQEADAWKGVFKSYNLGGIHARDINFIEEFQKNSKIPLFVSAQHEGGLVNQYGLNLYTRSAYLVGKEYEGLVKVKNESPLAYMQKEPLQSSQKERKITLICHKLDVANRRSITKSLINSVDELIRLFSELQQKRYVSPNPNNLSPLIIHSDGRFEIKPFDDLPIEWLRRFPNQTVAFCAYQLFAKTFEKWIANQSLFNSGPPIVISKLNSFKDSLEKKKAAEEEKGEIRALCLATHPDDEDGEALLYFKKKLNCLTYLLLATRGEAGENEIGPLLYEELGALRTEEMDKAAQHLGVDGVYYLGKVDFGYCLDPQEAFKNWDKQDTLEKLVYFYRLIRPHVIITRHCKSDVVDHGQHKAFIALAEEAFDLSADPQVYPEMQNEGLFPWQPLKFYQRLTYSELSPKDEKENYPVVTDAGEQILPESKTIQQIAFEAIKEHHTQGDWQWKRSKEPKQIIYQLVKSKTSVVQQDDFLLGIIPDNSLPEILQDKREVSFSGLPEVKITKHLNIGLIENKSNILFVALKTLGYNFAQIDSEALKKGDLSKFDAIIVGQGEYNTSPEVAQANRRLLDFVERGGNLIVFAPQYSRQFEFPYAPYPIKITFNPIVDENAPVDLLFPGYPLFNFPNKISSEDFQGWIQDRGLSFPSEYSEKYIALVSCADSKNTLIKGGYLVANYGKGTYIYTSFAWHRQFKAFHCGAYKNLANMLAYSLAQKDEK